MKIQPYSMEMASSLLAACDHFQFLIFNTACLKDVNVMH